MPYVGNTPSTSFATIVKDTFNGGSTGYTLSKVATTNSVSVFVENVRQEPTTAYSVSGTTLTFTATTPSGTGNIYVLHMNPTTTTTHPAAQNLTAVDGTFTGNIDVDGTANLDVVDIDGAVDMASTLGVTGNVTLGGTLDMNGAELILDADADTSITADTDDQVDIKVAGSDLAHITSTYAKLRGATPLVFGENNSTGTFQSISGEVGANNLLLRSYQSLTFKNGTSGSSLTDGTTAFNIDANGHVTMPKQSAFMAYLTTATNNLANGSAQTLSFQAEQFDLNADFASNTTFTAPVDGKYLLSASIRLDSLHSNTNYVYLGWQTSNRNIVFWLSAPADWNGSAYYTASGSVLCDMDANDTAYIYYYGQGGTDQADHTDGYFSGYLVA